MIKLLYLTNREVWREWLEKNHTTKKEIWLVYYKKHTGKNRIPYDDAVEEALCFGLIDSIVRQYLFLSSVLLYFEYIQALNLYRE